MAVVVVLALTALPNDRQYLIPLCLAASLILPFEHVRLMLLAVDHGSAFFSRYNVIQLVSAVAFPTLLIASYGLGVTSTGSVILLAVVASTLGATIAMVGQRQGVIRGTAFPSKRTLIWEGRQFAVSVVAANLFNRIDMLLVIWLASVTTQGYYTAAAAATSLLIVAPNALALFSFNSGARAKDSTDIRGLLRGGIAVAVFQGTTALAFAVILPTLIVLVFGEPFRQAIPLAVAIVPGYAIAGVLSCA